MLGWYVMHSKPQKEAWLTNQLTMLQFETYCPCLWEKNRRAHSSKPKPYFPGYLFVNFDLETTGISVLQWIPGALGLVSFGGEPACIPDSLVERVRHHLDEINGRQNEMVNDLQVGDEVQIHTGAFAGYDAIFYARLHGSERVQVLLRILQDQVIRISLPVTQLTATKQNRTLH